MPEIGWQFVVCGVIVAWAVYLLTRDFIQLARGRSGGCQSGGCGDCPSGSSTAEESSPGFVPLQALDIPARDERQE